MLITERTYILIPPSVFPYNLFFFIMAYLEVVANMVELMLHLTVVMLSVGVARSPLYVIMLPPTINLTLFFSVLFGQFVKTMQM